MGDPSDNADRRGFNWLAEFFRSSPVVSSAGARGRSRPRTGQPPTKQRRWTLRIHFKHPAERLPRSPDLSNCSCVPCRCLQLNYILPSCSSSTLLELRPDIPVTTIERREEHTTDSSSRLIRSSSIPARREISCRLLTHLSYVRRVVRNTLDGWQLASVFKGFEWPKALPRNQKASDDLFESR